MKARAVTTLCVLVVLIVGFASGYAAAGRPAEPTAPSAAVSDALKLRVERWRLRVANLQIAALQLEQERTAIQVEAKAVGDELRKALGAKPGDDIDLATYSIVKKNAPPVAEPPTQ
jgi:hypothetical protein